MDDELQRPDVTRGHATLTSRYPPGEESLTRRMMLRLAAGAWEDTDELTAEFVEMAEEFAAYFPGEEPVDADDIPGVLEQVIAEYRRVVTDTSYDAIAFAALPELLAQRAIVTSWGDGFDSSEAVQVCSEFAGAARAAGTPARGYAYVHTQDLDGMILTGRLHIGFGVFGPADESAAAVIGGEIAAILRAAELPVEWDGRTSSRIHCAPVLYEFEIEDD